MQDILATLCAALLAARTFEGAAGATLAPMLRLASEGLAAGRHTGRGRILRGMVHLRPGDGYRGLVVMEQGAAAARPLEAGTPAHLPSASAWRWVATYGCAVTIDVTLGKVEPHLEGGGVVVREKLAGPEVAFGRESAARLLERAATHLAVVPLRLPGAVIGMISLEADCQAAIGRPFWGHELLGALQLVADVAAPHLASLPMAPPPPAARDELLPVLGAKMAGLVQMARVFAEQEETILLGGPTGAGKSRIARWCHAQSRRKAKRFEALDLMTVPDELQMGELFGWKKGAFSGAVTDNPGAVARADGGTLFIDEIDKLSLKAQAGLLQVLEERRYRALGDGSGERRADVRFLVGTNADLGAAVVAGKFREDLYYRINVLPVKLLPLDERADEIPEWAHYMLQRRHEESVPEGRAHVAPQAARALVAARWPGNLRQLDNIIRRAYALVLVEQGGLPREITLEARHVERALGYEGGGGAKEPAFAQIRRAAEAVVDEAERREAAGEALDLDLAEAFRGVVLGTAARRKNSKEAAFRLLGKAGVVQNRNHQKAFRREIEKVNALLRALGQDGEGPFDDLVEKDEK
ncbi:sigma 54-interacting transcriptional regulator [Polyangium sp. 6x1]|uniref:sigma-54-dependent transcriptional regulator n=1 Tax=Polyangium sp. 6x1 TaxID=3042689 RepID=UPI0024827431|nr:sigma 54-interacting transcriptional regulator [Polyangium sp. 6x1]MDI1447785.1 sigma 54-interacting transcriptional regulator [Polyangium sp. 6x1]